MKKIFLFLSAISFVAISSCSSNDDGPATNPAVTDILLKRAVYQQANGDGLNFTADYFYDGNKLLKEQYNDGSFSKFFYSGDLITKVEYFVDGTLYTKETFAYNPAGKLTEYRHRFMSDSSDDIYTYTYNSNNTVTRTTVGLPSETSTMTYTNGEISKEVQSNGNTYLYTYDSNNNPMKNVTGYAEIADAVVGDYELHGRAKNIISIILQNENQNYMMNSFIYNSNGYPTKVNSAAIFDDSSPNNTEYLTVTYSY